MTAAQHALLLLWESLIVGVEVFLQKLWMLRLPPLERIGLSRDGELSCATGSTSLAAPTPASTASAASSDSPSPKVCVVTGPTSGIGREIAKEMHRRGYWVILACRNRAKGEQLAAELQGKGLKEPPTPHPLAKASVHVLDVSSLTSVRQFANEWNNSVRLPVHVLINNAGIFSMSAPREETCDGFESHMGTNHLGHFLLTDLLLPWLKKARQETGRPARVVNVSSKLHRMGRIHRDDPHLANDGGFNPLTAYAQSKLAQVLFAKECSRRYDGVVRCLSVHPGEVLTDVVRSLPGTMQRLYKLIMRLFLLTPAQGTKVLPRYSAPVSQAPSCLR